MSEASLLLYPEQGFFHMEGLLALRITPNLEDQTTTTTQGHGRAIAVHLGAPLSLRRALISYICIIIF
jgi:hypothetical protein